MDSRYINQLRKNGCEVFPTEDEIQSFVWNDVEVYDSDQYYVSRNKKRCDIYKHVSWWSGTHYYCDYTPKVKVFTEKVFEQSISTMLPSFDQLLAKLPSRFADHAEVFKKMGEKQYQKYCDCLIGFNSITFRYLCDDGQSFIPPFFNVK